MPDYRAALTSVTRYSSFTSSPTFFFLRLGILILSVPVAYGLSRVWVAEPLQEFGRASLFVYWVHVELVYGVASASIHRQLPLPISFVAFTAFSLAMFALVRLKMAIPGGRPTKSSRTGRTIAVLTQNRS